MRSSLQISQSFFMVASGKYWLLKAHLSHSSTSAFLVSLAGPGLGGFLPSGML